MNFFKELVKAIEISLIGGKFKFHINFTTTSNLLDLFKNAEEEAKKKAEEEKKREEEEEEKLWEEGKKADLWDDDDWD